MIDSIIEVWSPGSPNRTAHSFCRKIDMSAVNLTIPTPTYKKQDKNMSPWSYQGLFGLEINYEHWNAFVRLWNEGRIREKVTRWEAAQRRYSLCKLGSCRQLLLVKGGRGQAPPARASARAPTYPDSQDTRASTHGCDDVPINLPG